MVDIYHNQNPQPYVYNLKTIKGVDIATGDTVKIKPYRIIDGDSIEVTLDSGLDESKKTQVREDGADTPETRKSKCGKCKKNHTDEWVQKEKVMGKRAKGRVIELFDTAEHIMVVSKHFDKYGGRIDSDTIVKLDGLWYKVGDILIDEHLAVAYSGDTKSCFKELVESGYYVP